MRRTVSIVGGGSCALMLAAELDPAKFIVQVFERNAAPGRKFLVAGDGGLNLTHSEPAADFMNRYTPPEFLQKAFSHFSNTDLVNWLHNAGIATYTGSSGRVFPAKGLRALDVLNTFLRILGKKDVTIFTRHEWCGFANNHLVFNTRHGRSEIKSDIVVFCLGGGSWSVTGSTGAWTGHFSDRGIRVLPFMPSNCGFRTSWPIGLAEKIAGKPLKNISISCNGINQIGEVVLTEEGIEGSGIYPLSPRIRELISTHGHALITVDLKPSLSAIDIQTKISGKPQGVTYSTHIRNQLRLTDAMMALLKHYLKKEEFLDPRTLSLAIKNLQLQIIGMAPLDEAISTVGGIARDEVDADFQLKKMPGFYAIGEMLDYDAPTGGYLLQSCFTMGKFLASHLNNLFNIQKPDLRNALLR